MSNTRSRNATPYVIKASQIYVGCDRLFRYWEFDGHMKRKKVYIVPKFPEQDPIAWDICPDKKINSKPLTFVIYGEMELLMYPDAVIVPIYD